MRLDGRDDGARDAHSASTVTPCGMRDMDASPLVATSNARFRGAAASPPEKTFSRGHRSDSALDDAVDGRSPFSSSSTSPPLAAARVRTSARRVLRARPRARGAR
jgi:hypothetical protein